MQTSTINDRRGMLNEVIEQAEILRREALTQAGREWEDEIAPELSEEEAMAIIRLKNGLNK